MRDMSHACILRALFLGTQFSCLWCFTRVVGTTRAWLALHARGWHYTRVVGTTRAWLAFNAWFWSPTLTLSLTTPSTRIYFSPLTPVPKKSLERFILSS